MCQYWTTPDPQRLTLNRLHNAQIAKIVIGKDDTEFYAHKNVLEDASAFFRASLNGRSREAQSQTFDLIQCDITPNAFNHFLNWAYLPKCVDVDLCATILGGQFTHDAWKEVLDLYRLADKLSCINLKDRIVGEVSQGYGGGISWGIPPSFVLVDALYNYSPKGKGLFQLFVDLFASARYEEVWYIDGLEEYLRCAPNLTPALALAFGRAGRKANVDLFGDHQTGERYFEQEATVAQKT